MAQFPNPHEVNLPTVDGDQIKIVCPICSHDYFLDSGPDEEEIRKKGFQHVLTGLLEKQQLLVTPVRFKHCANCGYVLQFMIGDFSQEEEQ